MVSGAAGTSEQKKKGATSWLPFFCCDFECSENDRSPTEKLPRIRLQRGRLCTFDEVLGVAPFGRCLIVCQLTGGAIDVAVNHADRWRPRIHRAGEKVRSRRIVARNHLSPDWSGERSAGCT